jgi:RNA polymerase sigma factor (TIGR02999 family)
MPDVRPLTAAMQTHSQLEKNITFSRLRAQFNACYRELNRIAHNKLRNENANITLDTSALVHEVYFKLHGHKEFQYQNNAHLIAIAAITMRRILVDYARQKRRQKRGGESLRLTYGAIADPAMTTPEQILELNDLLVELKQNNKRQGKVVEYHFFGGYKHEEIAQLLAVSIDTVRRDWRLARAWLSSQLNPHI